MEMETLRPAQPDNRRSAPETEPPVEPIVQSSPPPYEAVPKPPPSYRVEDSAKADRERRRMILIVLGAGVIFAAIMGGILGGVLGKKHDEDGITYSYTPLLSPNHTMSGTASPNNPYAYPTPIVALPGQVRIFTHPDTNVYARTQNLTLNGNENTTSTIGPWVSLTGNLTITAGLAVAAVSRATGIVDVFALSPSGECEHKFINGNGSSWVPGVTIWESLGGNLTSPLAVVSWAWDRMDLFATGAEDALYTLSWTPGAGWGDIWVKMGGMWAGYAPTAVSWGEGRIDVFLVGRTDQCLYHTWLEPGSEMWRPQGRFENLGGFLTGRPAAVSVGVGRLDVFVRGGDAWLWRLEYSSGGWKPWIRVNSGVVQAEPDAIGVPPNRIDVLTWGEYNTYYIWSFVGGEPMQSIALGFGYLGPPKGLVSNDGAVHIYGFRTNGDVVHELWDRATETSYPYDYWDNLGNPYNSTN